MGPKKLVKAFYNAHVVEEANIVSRFFHPDLQLTWFSSHGKVVMGFDQLDAFFKEINKTYDDLRVSLHHVVKEGNTVAVRCTYYARPLKTLKRKWLSHISMRFGKCVMELLSKDT